MKQKSLIAICIFITSAVVAQRQNRQLEIYPYLKLDKYPQFSYILNGRPNVDYVNIKGTSFGINFAYKIPISKQLFIKPGIGYYKYSFSKITRNNTSFGTTNSRNIIFPSPLLIPFFTDKYHYNTINANISLEKEILLKKNYQLALGVGLNNYITISQNYHLTFNPNESQNFKKSNKKYFGSMGMLYFNVLKKINKIKIGPSLIIPVLDVWKTDETFQEETSSNSRNKWFKGIGFGISINYSLK